MGILDSFHFDVAVAGASSGTLGKREEEGEERGREEQEEIKEGEEEKGENEEEEEMSPSLTLQQKIHDTIVKTIIPSLAAVLTKVCIHGCDFSQLYSRSECTSTQLWVFATFHAHDICGRQDKVSLPSVPLPLLLPLLAVVLSHFLCMLAQGSSPTPAHKLSSKSNDHEANVLRVPVAMAMTKLLLHLPQSTLITHLPRFISHMHLYSLHEGNFSEYHMKHGCQPFLMLLL